MIYLGPTESGASTTRKQPTRWPSATRRRRPSTKIRVFRATSRLVCSARSPKKPRGQELSVADKFLNQVIASIRIEVEHVIAGIKRCRIVKDVLRLTKEGVSDVVMEIACGLHNLRVDCRHPLPEFDLRKLA